MTKIGCFEYSGGVGEWFVNTINEIASYHTGLIATIGTRISFLFNIINIIGSKLACILSVGKLSHSGAYTQNP